MTPTQAAAYFCTFHKLAASCSRDVLNDVYGFLVSDTAPLDPYHVYHKFVALEDMYTQELLGLREELGNGMPLIKSLVGEHLGVAHMVDERFFDLVSLSHEE